jgi:hypothetical protein
MRAILSVFAGQARLADAPDQVFETTTTAPTRTTTTTVADEDGEDGEDGATDAAGTPSTLPVIEAEENTIGVVPDRSIVCN